MSLIYALGIISGCLQIAGYLYYIKKTELDDISPNPTTWLIFAFDTVLLTILEAIAGASLPLLFLPAACAIGATYVAWQVRRAGRLHWPQDSLDKYILLTGITIAVAYTAAFTLAHLSIIPLSYTLAAAYTFLILSNVNTFIAFVPIIREVKADPTNEDAGPWTVWTAAYATLLILTYLEVGSELSGLILYLYPGSCVILHGLIAVLARDSRKKRIEATTGALA